MPPCIAVNVGESVLMSSVSTSPASYPTAVVFDSGTFQLAANSQSPPQPVRITFSGGTDAVGTTISGTLTTTEGGGPSVATQVVLRRP